MIKLAYDKKADAIYIYLSNAPYSYGIDIDKERRIDYAEDGTPIGVELLCVKHGVITDDLPNREEIERALSNRGIRVFA